MAPLLRPQTTNEDQGGQSSDGYLPAFGVQEGELHDVEILPHMYDDDESRRLFPLLEAPPPSDNVEDWQPMERPHGCDGDQWIADGVHRRSDISGKPVPRTPTPSMKGAAAGAKDQRHLPHMARSPGSMQAG